MDGQVPGLEAQEGLRSAFLASSSSVPEQVFPLYSSGLFWGEEWYFSLCCLPSSLASLLIQSAQFSCSVISDSATPWTAARQASLSITNSRSLLKFMFIELVMPSNHLILCHPLLLLPSIFPSIRVFSNESSLCIRWPNYWSFSFNISPSKYSGLISFRMDWLDLLEV